MHSQLLKEKLRLCHLSGILGILAEVKPAEILLSAAENL